MGKIVCLVALVTLLVNYFFPTDELTSVFWGFVISFSILPCGGWLYGELGYLYLKFTWEDNDRGRGNKINPKAGS